ncbi:MAG: Redoxin domain protein [Solirubrobacteraceae bacterium]|nr:Redoxin domain protein [Solirubrobacteraceae bacterium]
MKRPQIVIAAVAVVVVLVIGITQLKSNTTHGGSAPSLTAAQRLLAGSPPALDALHHDADQLLPGSGLAARIAALRGHPIVVNAWGSWCGPCRQEFPLFQRVSAQLGKRVAFLGIDVQDPRSYAAKFLASHPVTYPSYQDLDKKIADQYGLIGTPSTIFYDAKGRKAFLHSGPYTKDADLRADIKRYAGA